MRAIWGALLGGVLLVLAAGCGEEGKGRKTTIELKDVPADIMKIAKEKLPGVTFDTAWRKSNGSFEIRGKDKTGKVREIDLRPDGSIEEIE